MKRTKRLQWLAVLTGVTMMCLTMTSCSVEDNVSGGDNTTPQLTTPPAIPVYRLSIPASRVDYALTRAVSLNAADGLDATFRTTDDILVFNKTKNVYAQDKSYNYKLLHPDADGATAKLTGELTFYGYPRYKTVDVGDVLQLCNNADGDISYEGIYLGGHQSGSLACLSLFDFATADVSITGISGAGTADDPYTLTTSPADFVSAQSMFMFIFTGLAKDVDISAVTIHSAEDKLINEYSFLSNNPDNSGDVTINFGSFIDDGSIGSDGNRREANNQGAEDQDIVYAALHFLPLGASETDDITFTVMCTDNHTYTATMASPVGGFLNGKYYTLTIELTPVLEPQDQ